MYSANDIINILKTNINKIESFHVSKIALFGSYVRDEQHSNSDIDILVEFENKFETFDNYMDLKFYLEDLFDRKVDLVIISSIKPILRDRIMRSVRYAKGA